MKQCPRLVVAAAAAASFLSNPFFGTQPAWAQDSPGVADESGARAVRAVRIDELSIDGRLDEAVYSTHQPVSGFVQQEPREGEPASEPTEVWVFFDARNLYVSARLWDSRPERIVADEMRRDGAISNNDSFAIILDTFRDRRTGFLFITNPLGGLQDGHVTSEADYNGNFDPIWTAQGGRFERGWMVEVAIPFRSLRYGSPGEQAWGINFRRRIPWKGEVSHLTDVPASFGMFAIMRLSEAATLTGIVAPEAGLNLDLKPYVISRVASDRIASPPISNDADGDVGFDVKYGVTQGLTADFTYNTDFAQVEDDQQQINLTRFGLFFPEKREFFLEGQGIFNFGGGGGDVPILFFSRRIGLSNNRVVPIRAGGRLTGKVDRFSIGLLDIQTGASEQADARPVNFAVARLRRDIFEKSSIGAIVTSRHEGGAISAAYGLDTNLAFGVTTVNAYYAESSSPGSGERDASYYAAFDYNSDRYGVKAEHLVVGDDFEPDAGFLRRENFRKHSASLRFSPRPAGSSVLRKVYYEAGLSYYTDNDGRLESRSATARVAADLVNDDQISANYSRDYELLVLPFPIQDGAAVPPGRYSFQNLRLAYTRAASSRVSGTVSADAGSFYGGSRYQLSYTGRVSLTPRLGLEPRAEVNWIQLPASFTTRLFSVRSLFAFSPRSTLGALVQYNSSSDSVSSNVRFQWEYQPGSSLFVVYSEGRTTETPELFPRLQNRAFVIKLTRLFRP